MRDYKETIRVEGWEERLFDFCTKAIIPITILWGITGIIAVIVNCMA